MRDGELLATTEAWAMRAKDVVTSSGSKMVRVVGMKAVTHDNLKGS